MNRILISKLNAKSVIVGALLALTATVLLGADKPGTSNAKILQQRFLVLESSPTGKPANGYQSHLLKVCPHYGKIDHDSLKFRLAKETQEIKMIVTTSEGLEIRRGDIVGFRSLEHVRLGPGSKVVRHLPSGDQELVGAMADPLGLAHSCVRRYYAP